MTFLGCSRVICLSVMFESRAVTRKSSVTRSCPAASGIWKLDLSGTAVRDSDVANVLVSLPQLQLLLLNSCRKLTPAVVGALLPPSGAQPTEPAGRDALQSMPSQGGETARLRGLALARCFQLDGRALSGLLQVGVISHSHTLVEAITDLSSYPTGRLRSYQIM